MKCWGYKEFKTNKREDFSVLGRETFNVIAQGRLDREKEGSSDLKGVCLNLKLFSFRDIDFSNFWTFIICTA